MRDWWSRLSTFKRVMLVAVVVLVVIWAIGFVVLGASTAEAKKHHPPGCSRLRDPLGGWANQVPCPVRDPFGPVQL